MLLTGQAVEVEKAVCAEKMVSRGKFGSRAEKVALKRFGPNQANCPWIRQATPVAKDKVAQVDRVAIWVIAPKTYRQVFIQNRDDAPVRIISQLAANAWIQRASLTGGQWREQNIGTRKQLIGCLRINTTAATKLIQKSGDQGIFVSAHPSNKTTLTPRCFGCQKFRTKIRGRTFVDACGNGAETKATVDPAGWRWL